VFRLVRQANPQARTIVITGHRAEMDQRVQQLLDEGADAVCYKPFEVPKLLAALNRLTQEEPNPKAASGETPR
jgi:CheY-like chemotaxis protein